MYAAASNVNSAPNISVQGTISWNTAYNGGGIYANNDINQLISIYISSNSLTSPAGYILNNTAKRDSTHHDSNYGIGGGVYIKGYVSFAMWKNSQINDNTASYWGGGVYARNVQGVFFITTYREIKKTSMDGEIYCAYAGPISLKRPQVCGNSSGGGMNGSGIHLINTPKSALCDIDMYGNTSSATTTYQMYCYSSESDAIHIFGITSIVGNIRIGGNSTSGNYIDGGYSEGGYNKKDNMVDQYFAYNGWIGNVKKDSIPEYDGTTSITTLFNNYKLNISYLEKITVDADNGFAKTSTQYYVVEMMVVYYYMSAIPYYATVVNNDANYSWISGAVWDGSNNLVIYY